MKGKILGGGLVLVVGSILNYVYNQDILQVVLFVLTFGLVVLYANKKPGGC